MLHWTSWIYYWEIGDASGAKVSGSVGQAPRPRPRLMWVFSASKWLYAANVVQKRGVLTAGCSFLNFTSGYSNFGNVPVCVGVDPTVASLPRRQGCAGRRPRSAGSPTTVGTCSITLRQRWARPRHNVVLAADLNATVGNLGLEYPYRNSPPASCPAAGLCGVSSSVAAPGISSGSSLGKNKVCAQSVGPDVTRRSRPIVLGMRFGIIRSGIGSRTTRQLETMRLAALAAAASILGSTAPRPTMASSHASAGPNPLPAITQRSAGDWFGKPG